MNCFPSCPDLLESNDAPLDAEIAIIRRYISESQSRMAQLKAQINELPVEREQMQSEYDAIAESVRTHTRVLSPVRRVPVELWLEIFASIKGTRRIQGETRICPPWSLGFICRSWRDAVLSTPSFWSSIDLPQPMSGRPLFHIHPGT
ncbi:hypothetical protein FB45DRAFT_890023 [Roridomyces roridus]|uniref:F-box domain-containing protein n=1 Tax=Roridomyces roridus TaxID=1738132 RepID=A0AAD7FZD9_9AGAR|nr:hypothetical protein FB45DRAFT_890023 [Roridomyces roridus]